MKTVLRRQYREKRSLLSDTEISKMTDLMLINFQKLDLPFVNCVHTYLASADQHEIDTYIFTRYLEFLNPDLKIVIPKIDPADGSMKHFIFNEETELVLNQFGIPEPAKGDEVHVSKIELVLTPLLLFDQRGFRVGYGKGYYDKFFATCSRNVIKIGLSFFEPIPVINDINRYDIPLNYCITPGKIFEFKK